MQTPLLENMVCLQLLANISLNIHNFTSLLPFIPHSWWEGSFLIHSQLFALFARPLLFLEWREADTWTQPKQIIGYMKAGTRRQTAVIGEKEDGGRKRGRSDCQSEAC